MPLALAALVAAVVVIGIRIRDVAVGRPGTVPSPVVRVDARYPARVVGAALFGVGVDLSVATYKRSSDTRCQALADAATTPSLVRIGAGAADDYDWPSDKYGRVQASFQCPPLPSGRAAASVLRVLDRVRALGATAVVVLNGEIDDPQVAAGLVRLIAGRYGLRFARRIYWEIGNAPAQWQDFGVPLSRRQNGEHIHCTPDQYAALVTSYTAAIAVALGVDLGGGDPAPRIVADAWITNATDQSWTGPVTVVDIPYFPFNSPLVQPSTPADVANSVTIAARAAGASTLDEQVRSLRDTLAQYGGSDVGLFVGQWNIDHPSSTNALYDSPAQAVFVARLLMRLMRDGVAMSAWSAPLYGNPPAPLGINGHTTAGFHIFAALRALAGARLLPVIAPDGLDALAARRPDGRVTVVLANAGSHDIRNLPLQIAGGPGNRTSATIQTFDQATPRGASSRRTILPSRAHVTVPALGVVLLTLPAH